MPPLVAVVVADVRVDARHAAAGVGVGALPVRRPSRRLRGGSEERLVVEVAERDWKALARRHLTFGFGR